MSKNRVLIIYNEVSNMGGAGKSLDELLEKMMEYVDIFAVLPMHGQREEILKKKNVKYKIIEFKNDWSPSYKWKDNLRDNYYAACHLKQYVLDNRIDIIHTNSSISNVGEFLSMMTGIPHVWHVRECLYLHYGLEYLNEEIKTRLFHLSDCIISISDTVSKYLFSRYRLESIRVYDGVEAGKYLMDIDRCFKPNSFYFAGTVTEDKGIWTILRAIKHIKNEIKKSVRLIIAGECCDKTLYAIRKYIDINKLEDDIEIVGFQDDLSTIRSNSEFCIVASKYEALSRSTIEAMLSGNMVIASDTGGTKELIGNNERGLIFKENDYIDLANKMILAMNYNKSLKNFICLKAQRYAINEFDVTKSVNALLDVYMGLLDKRSDRKNNSKEKMLTEVEQLIHEDDKAEEKVPMNLSIITGFDKNIVAEKMLEYIKNNDLKNISIYGMGYFGRFLYDYLSSNGIKIKYVVDRESLGLEKVFQVFKPSDTWLSVDIMINSVVQGSDGVDKLIDARGIKRIGIVDFINDVLK